MADMLYAEIFFFFSDSLYPIFIFNFVSQHTLLLPADERGDLATEEGCGDRRNWVQWEIRDHMNLGEGCLLHK